MNVITKVGTACTLTELQVRLAIDQTKSPVTVAALVRRTRRRDVTLCTRVHAQSLLLLLLLLAKCKLRPVGKPPRRRALFFTAGATYMGTGMIRTHRRRHRMQKWGIT